MYKKNNIKVGSAFVIMLALWSLVLAQSPFMIDDWVWGRYKIGTIPSYGGRFIGNFFEVLLTASHQQVLTGVSKSLTLAFICLMVCLISGKVNVRRIACFNILFLLMSMSIMNESFIWTAGFVNYVLPFVFVLPVVYINQLLKKQKYSRTLSFNLKIISLICIFLSGFFLENLSTTFIFYLGTELVLNAIFYRKNWIYGILSLLTSIGSFIIMILHSDRFTNKASGGYSKTTFKTFDEFYQNFKAVQLVIKTSVFHNNKLLLILVSLFFVLFVATVLIKLNNKKEAWLYCLTILQAILVFLCPTYQLVILAPNLISNRMFFPSIMVLILIGCILFAFIEENAKNKMVVNVIVACLLIGSSVFPTLVFVDMAKWNTNINRANQQAITHQTTINYSQIKPKYHQYYYCDANGPMIGANWMMVYQEYYGIPKNVNIK